MRERTLFLTALEMDVTERPEFLSVACAADETLRKRVEALLLAHEKSRHVFDDESDPPSAVGERIGDVIGDYKLLEQLGEGGFGVVYLAEQQSRLQRRVALKIIKPGMDTRQVVARFEAERQALAMLGHANIATVFEAGATDSGRPYFAMELVNGVSITEFCDQRKLCLRDRLVLFVDVCHAVQHAHDRGIIHRDVKPSNVMVTLHDQLPTPKIIDFGIAKAVGYRLTEKTVFTRYDQIVGTPQYMSPEQADMSESEVDARTDVYALGVLLYELLTGSTPLDSQRLQSSTDSEIVRLIQTEVSPKPSTRVSALGNQLQEISEHRSTEPAKLTRLIRGELDWIAMMALAKDRDRRYASANALAEDIVRHLEGIPVLAGPPSAFYQVRSFSKRHRRLMLVVSSVFAALLIALVATLAMYFEVSNAYSETLVADYASDMQLAGFEWNSQLGSVESVQSLLNRHLPLNGGEDLRDFAWRYQWTLLNESNYAFSESPVVEMSLMPDGRLVTLDRERVVRYWDQQTGEPLRGREVVVEHPIRDVALSPNGMLIAVASADQAAVREVDVAATGDIILTDASSGEVRWHHRLDVAAYDVIFSSDSRHLGVLSTAGLASVWEVATGLRIGQIELRQTNMKDPVGLGRRSMTADLATGGGSVALTYDPSPYVITQYELSTGDRQLLQGHDSSAVFFKYDPRGVTAASSDSAGSILYWDVASNQETGRQNHQHGGAAMLAFSSDGRTVASGGKHGKVILSDTQLGTSKTLKGHAGAITALAFGAGDSLLVTADDAGVIKRWDLSSDRSRHPGSDSMNRCTFVAFSADNRWIVMAGNRRGENEPNDDPPMDRVEIWSVNANAVAQRFEIPHVRSLAFSPDSQQIAIGQRDGVVTICSVTTGETIDSLNGTPPPWPKMNYVPNLLGRRSVGSLAYAPNGRYLVAGFGSRLWTQPNYKQALQIWDIKTRESRIIQAHQNDIRVTFSPDGKRLATCSEDCTIKIWNVHDWTVEKTLSGKSRYSCACFHPDGDELFAGNSSGRIEAWSIRTGTQRLSMVGHAGRIYELSVTSDGRTLASCAMDRTVRLWNIDRGIQLLRLPDFEQRVTSVAFSPDGNRLAAASLDGTVRVFEARTLVDIDAILNHAGQRRNVLQEFVH